MPELYFPSNKTHNKIINLVQGFWLEQEKKELVLSIKFEPSVLTKLISGCKFELVIRNPKLAPRSLTIYIYDNPKDPLWTTWQEFGIEDKNYVGFDDIVLNLVKAKQIRIVYYTHKNIPVFTKLLNKTNKIEDFNKWIYQIFNNNEPIEKVYDGRYFPEDTLKGFKIEIENIDCSNDPKMNFITPFESLEWDEETSRNSYYNFDEYMKDGKHGYNQEISIKSFLSNFFNPNEELFYSPLKTDGNELIDFLICHENAVILIESKNIISEKKTKLNSALIKGINQLNLATKIITNDVQSVGNKNHIVEKLKKCNIVLRICLFNDSQNLLGGKTNNITSSFTKEELPIFISVMVFFQLIADIKISYGEEYKFNIIQNLISLYEEYLISNEKIFIIREFRLNQKD